MTHVSDDNVSFSLDRKSFRILKYFRMHYIKNSRKDVKIFFNIFEKRKRIWETFKKNIKLYKNFEKFWNLYRNTETL